MSLIDETSQLRDGGKRGDAIPEHPRCSFEPVTAQILARRTTEKTSKYASKMNWMHPSVRCDCDNGNIGIVARKDHLDGAVKPAWRFLS